jgi:hypothetical protein
MRPSLPRESSHCSTKAPETVTGAGGCRANGATSNSPGRSPGYDTANNRSRPIGPTLPLWGVAVRRQLSTQGFALGFFRSHLWCDIGAV